MKQLKLKVLRSILFLCVVMAFVLSSKIKAVFAAARPCIKHIESRQIVMDATCTSSGYGEIWCSKCQQYLGIYDIPAKGHNYTTTKSASCYSAGEKKCTRCNHTEDIPQKNHSYRSNVVLSPTCTSSGITTYKCRYCGDEYAEMDPPRGHS